MITLLFTRKHTPEELGLLNTNADATPELDHADWTFSTTRNIRGAEVTTLTITRAGTIGLNDTRKTLTTLANTLGLYVNH